MKKISSHLKSRHLLVILTIVCLVMIMFSVSQLAPLSPIKNGASTIIVPIQSGINKIGDWMNGQRIGRLNARQLADENAELKQRVKELQEQNMVLTENVSELDRLRKLYELDGDYTTYDKVAAQVVSKNAGNWFNTFTINRGSKDGITKDMNVLADGGLAGIVTEVGVNWATVRAVIDDGNSISCMLLTTSDNCIVSGDLSLIQEGKLSMTDLKSDAEAVVGDRVVTSNISDKYLPGILIGYVDLIEDDSNHLTKQGYILPAVNFSDIHEVLVIKQTKTIKE
ncbi:MAG: rod shape-determining protein MreC [Eubacteriales bacterium]|nr:rod shape-determining protein MreC [Eubacteriales bacterium]